MSFGLLVGGLLELPLIDLTTFEYLHVCCYMCQIVVIVGFSLFVVYTYLQLT